ncbi:class I SAM-dependent methyltransferase [Halomarina oriensis]|uniref:Methyltransferase domain-containing protein n=1 Tax=Halomarina oriensis TaxID=671145 RepID=A0A6B0GR25_9EURY|nr:class I SAM-dependent methyltransferase [Halomarina oriensis]MWG34575.1 methyltransferase domain-containing protein [Halomarina oriensis]
MTDLNRYTAELAASYRTAHERTDVGDESFYLDCATNTDGRVLEAACGTGRLYLELLDEGVDADGFDVSRPMLELLQERAATMGVQPTVWQADLRTVGTASAYDLVIVPYNSFCNLTTVDDQLAALDALHAALNPGGRLVFDVYVPQYDVIADAFGEWHSEREFEHDGRTLYSRTRTTIESQVDQTYRCEHEIRDTDGDEVAREEFVLAHLPPQQVELLARHSPFEQWSVDGGFDGDGLDDGDGVQLWRLRKAA